jgi:hypothetical protein
MPGLGWSFPRRRSGTSAEAQGFGVCRSRPRHPKGHHLDVSVTEVSKEECLVSSILFYDWSACGVVWQYLSRPTIYPCHTFTTCYLTLPLHLGDRCNASDSALLLHQVKTRDACMSIQLFCIVCMHDHTAQQVYKTLLKTIS